METYRKLYKQKLLSGLSTHELEHGKFLFSHLGDSEEDKNVLAAINGLLSERLERLSK